jgi:bud emergence protein 1
MKVKVFFQDDIIALRLPQDVVFAALKEKLMERLKVRDDIVIQYKDEPTNTLLDLDNDDNLDVALQRNPKLALYVSYASG